jgi:hypothetical protein
VDQESSITAPTCMLSCSKWIKVSQSTIKRRARGLGLGPGWLGVMDKFPLYHPINLSPANLLNAPTE